jgi:hypothetical protein
VTPPPDPDPDAPEDVDPAPSDDAAQPLVRLPASMRDAFKAPMGPVYEDVDELLADAGAPIVAVGDVVTYHLLEAGHDPAVAVVDGLTKRDAVDERVRAALAAAPGRRVAVANPAGTVTRALVRALVDAVGTETGTGTGTGTDADPGPRAGAADPDDPTPGDGGEGDGRPSPVTIDVDGEEDLATLPAILATPVGGSVVYGQPDEGMVLVAVTPAARREARSLLGRMDGDPEAALALLEAAD